MDWLKRMNAAIDFIEDNITGDIDYKQAARIACCPNYHFQRMFSFITGVPLSEYIRRRRLTLAAFELQQNNMSVIEVAQKYGYESHSSFTRAFNELHGVAPIVARKSGAKLKAYPRMSFHISITGGTEMNYRIEQKDAFRIVGIRKPLEKEIEKNFGTVPGMWEEAAMNGTIAKLASLMDGEPKGLLGVSLCNDLEDWCYYIAVSSNMKLPSGLEKVIVPKAMWAIFSGEGTNISIQQIERRIVTEWLPTSGYEYGNAPDIEVYLNPDPTNAKFEVWIPVVRKEK